MKAKLSMSVDRVPMGDGNPIERRGLLHARICVENVKGNGYSVDFFSDDRDQFEVDTIAAAFRNLLRLMDPPAERGLLHFRWGDARPEAINRVDN